MKINSKKIVLSSLAVAALAFTGCGGGGGDTAPAAYVPLNCLDTATNVLRGDCEVDLVLDATKVYELDGKVKVKRGASLTIPAGTQFKSGPGAYLVVAAGSKIYANGTSASPIVFDGLAGSKTTGASKEWGGLTVLGNAQVNEANLKYEVDDTDADFAFGSTTTSYNTESSGILKYVEIYNSGYAVVANKEVNGLSLAGVGSGTTVDNIKVYNSGDDGVEIWGGTVNLSNISITNAEDDSFDVDNGYTGTVTNLSIQQGPACSSLVEMTNSGDAAIVRTNVKIDGFDMNASANQVSEGGLYFKDADTTGTFTNGTIDMSASVTSKDAALTNGKDAVNVAPILSGITVTKSTSQTLVARRKGGKADDGVTLIEETAGTLVLKDAFTGDFTNVQ